MTTSVSQCNFCANRTTGKVCSAFPNGIPPEIWEGQVDHRVPFPGDNNIQFKPIEGVDPTILDKILA